MRLRCWNLGVGALHALQAAAILILATAVSLPVTRIRSEIVVSLCWTQPRLRVGYLADPGA
jgi:hypothetical protein